MPQSLVANWVHLIFSTKHRAPLLCDDIRADLHAYLSGILHNCQSPARIVGSVEDHVHVLFSLSKNDSLAHMIQEWPAIENLVQVI